MPSMMGASTPRRCASACALRGRQHALRHRRHARHDLRQLLACQARATAVSGFTVCVPLKRGGTQATGTGLNMQFGKQVMFLTLYELAERTLAPTHA